MNNYENMPNSVIDLLIFESIYGTLGSDKRMLMQFNKPAYNYSNNPEALGPLLVRGQISLITMDDGWEAHFLADDDEQGNTTQPTACRAVACCYLKKLDYMEAKEKGYE